MKNKDLVKKLAIALGTLIGGAGALNAVPMSAMEGNKQEENKQEEVELNTKIDAALNMAQNVDAILAC